MGRSEHTTHRVRLPAHGPAQEWLAQSATGTGKSGMTRNAPGTELEAPAQLRDEQIRRIYACCDPKLSDDARVTLLLHHLCGLGSEEIARALFISVATADKRLARGQNVLAASKRPLDFKSPKIAARLTAVQRALHLLFHEGYHGRHASRRIDLCEEAIRLVKLLLEHPPAQTGPTYGLAALMCLKAARLDGGFLPVEMLDRSNWDPELVAQGLAWLEQSVRGGNLADYQIEAMIAAVQASAPSSAETDWDAIVTLYDSLIAVRPSAIAALHRAMAIGRQQGAARGLEEVLSISESDILEPLPSYWSALGEFALISDKRKEARHAFRKARELARNPFERDHYAARIAACQNNAPATRAISTNRL